MATNKPKTHRWVCPVCRGGKLAPSKPRRDDVRRYCLRCSEKTGRLVERSAPALDAARDKAAQRRQERAAAERARKAAGQEKAAHRAAQRLQERRAPLDRAKEMALAALALFPEHSELSRSADYMRDRIEVRACRGYFASGVAWCGLQEATVWIHRDWETIPAQYVAAVSVVLHELAHLAAPLAEKHGPLWAGLFLDAVEKLTGIKPPRPIRTGARLTRNDVDAAAEVALYAAFIEGRGKGMTLKGDFWACLGAALDGSEGR